MKTKLLIFFFLLVSFFSFSPSLTHASDKFKIANDVTYTVEESGATIARFAISLTNTTTQYYTEEYGIRVGFSQIDHVSASDPQGPITPELTKTEDGYTIKVHFNQPAVGIDKTIPFTIQFETPDILQKEGAIFEVDIPGIANQSSFSTYDVHVLVPPSFGPPTYIKPDTNSKSLHFTKGQLENGGISIAFGQAQYYDFSLTYHLDNKNVFPVRTEIALPPSTNYQEVSLDSIEPKPLTVKIDTDGNWLAQYSLLPSEEKEIIVKGKVKNYLIPKEQLETNEALAKYTKPQKYWEVEHGDIKKLALELKTPQAIYLYVLGKLSYDFSRVTDHKGRAGAVGVLQQPTSAVCLEFTDLFIAIARAAGIPAREVDGFGYTQNERQRPLSFEEDILHAWPEYYDSEKKTWIMVDPTWGNTTKGVDYFDVLDFNHIAFAIKGVDSSYPVPAGSYKVPGGKGSKNIVMVPSEAVVMPAPSAHASLEMEEKIFAGLSLRGVVRVSNTHGVLYPAQDILVTSSDILPTEIKLHVPQIPPFGYVDIPFSFAKTSFWTDKNVRIAVHIGDTEVFQTVKVIPVYMALFQKQFLPWTIGGGVCIASIALIIFIITKRARNLPVS